MDHILGVDVGTGGTRAVVVDRKGTIVGSATAEHVPFASPKIGWAEQDPHDWYQATGSAIRQAISSAGVPPSEIAAVGLAGQMHGAVLLDEDNEVLRPALIWCDQRTQAQCDWLNAKIGWAEQDPHDWYQATGSAIRQAISSADDVGSWPAYELPSKAL